MLSCQDGKLQITLCETSCCGSLCPWNITLSGQGGGGGAAPTSKDTSR